MSLLPRLTTQTAIERRLANRILKLNPGMGDKTTAIAESLADSGLSPAAAGMLIAAVYSPTDSIGRGQGTRAKWFIAAIRNRYNHRLEKIRNDPKQFRTMIADMEEVTEMRDILNGEGLGVSFEAAFLLWEMGLDGSSALAIVEQTCNDQHHRGAAARLIIKAAALVKAGIFMTLENAIDSMRYGYEHDYDGRPDRS